MTNHTPTGGLRFEQDYSAAQFDDGYVVKFTRLERRALRLFNESAGRVLTRSQILDAVSEPGSEKNDRNIDFLISRIRSKLGDNANEPRFIRTQYGEGYIWLYSPGSVVADFSDTFVVVGPFMGLQRLGEMSGYASEFGKLLQADLRKLLGPEQKTALAPDFSKTQRESGPAISIQVSFFKNLAGVETIVMTRSGKDDRILDVTKFTADVSASRLAVMQTQSRLIAQRAISAHWWDAAENGSAAKPLAVAIYDSVQPKSPIWSWNDADRRLRPLREAHPDDPALKIMWATHIHAKYVKHGIKLFKEGTADCAADEAEIEKLVLEALEYAQSRPAHAAMAAKLLYFVNQNYRDLALELATKAYRADRSITSTLAVLGQMLGFVGEMEEAETHLSQALELSDDGSMQYYHALYMLVQAYTATAQYEKRAALLKRFYRRHPTAMLYFEPFFTDPYTPSLRAKGIALMVKRDQATAMLKQAAYISARLYQDPRHRENSLLTPVNLFVRRFGSGVVPAEVAMHLSKLQ
ncbi:winged helix-turn-helix domain-containing protein [Defluviimonas aestuarii]|uniref:winged helix-turn-helix domain-containing protein n=1 Tax=Albidovulum aestuarii TaxID=1130726 RepID=UPI00249A3BE6|nr:winged helix-turn-helix domain-containing protein [Defluviimonas aestuarii]MDI3338855.1 winged helix-turn-helix domain-containing protein [Defluviimonas aestuarii]